MNLETCRLRIRNMAKSDDIIGFVRLVATKK